MRLDRFRVLLLYALGAVAIALPIAAALRLAQYESLLQQEDRAAMIAGDILRRNEKVVDQMLNAFADLKSAGAKDPCSEGSLDLMRRLVVKSNLLVDVGYVAHDRLICSSFGRRVIPVGRPTFVSRGGSEVRLGVEHPLAPDARVIFVTDRTTGYTALVNQDSPLDFEPDESNVALGLISVQSKTLLAHRGYFDPEWLKTIGDQRSVTFFDGSSVVAWRRSERYDQAAFVAIGSTRIEEAQRRIVSILLPIGIGAGLMLVVVVAYLARLQLSVPKLLKQALKKNELFLVYQPIVDLASGAWVGAEALIRWRRPTGEVLGPDFFIPIAEQNGIIGRITDHAIRHFEHDMAALLRRHPTLFVALNLSAEDFSSPAILERLADAVRRMGIGTRNLHVEATERVFMNMEAARRNIHALRAAGIEVAIDDFGTGFSSLSYLHNLELDGLKIDKAFVETIGTQAVTSDVVGHIIELGKSLGLKMTAEGVETAEQANYLRDHGVQFAQGWLFARPMPVEQFLAGLEGS